MLLYHLMADEGVLPNMVIPQVPQNLMQGEDQRTYCAECNNSAFFDERKVSQYVWDAEITHECWLTEYSEPLRIEKRWLVDATIEKRRFLHDGEWWTYPIISHSVWSDAAAYPNPAFQEKILSLTKKCLEQN